MVTCTVSGCGSGVRRSVELDHDNRHPGVFGQVWTVHHGVIAITRAQDAACLRVLLRNESCGARWVLLLPRPSPAAPPERPKC